MLFEVWRMPHQRGLGFDGARPRQTNDTASTANAVHPAGTAYSQAAVMSDLEEGEICLIGDAEASGTAR
jgi:hypothetical protein